jgi:hypothetical protein
LQKDSKNSSLNASREETARLAEIRKQSMLPPEIQLPATNETDKHAPRLPIITHTCATPIATPSTSIRNLIIPIRSPIRRLKNGSSSSHEIKSSEQQGKNSLDLEFNDVTFLILINNINLSSPKNLQ